MFNNLIKRTEMANFIPRPDREALRWLRAFLKALAKIRVRIGFPEEEYDQLEKQADDFEEKLDIAEAPETRTSPNIKRKDLSRLVWEPNVRELINCYIAYNKAVTDDDRLALSVTVRKKVRGRATVLDIAPDVEIDTSILRMILVYFFLKGGKRGSAKPAYQHGAELIFAVSDQPINDLEELGKSRFRTRSPFRLKFTDKQRGKVLSFAIRWENTRGEKGAWSAIYHVVIP
jgi:hypothetical protein